MDWIKLDQLLIETRNKYMHLINSDTTRRYYWATLQAEAFHATTHVIEELLKFENPIEAMRCFLDRLDYGVVVAKNGFSQRQTTIARYGLLYSKRQDADKDDSNDEADEEDFREYLGYGGDN